MNVCFLVTYGNVFGHTQQAICETQELAVLFQNYASLKGYIFSQIDVINMPYETAIVTI